MGLRTKPRDPLPVCPPGTHIGRVVRVIDLGIQPSDFYEPAHKVLVSFEFPKVLIQEGERAGEPYMLSNHYTASTHEKSNNYKDMSALGHQWTDEELEGNFDFMQYLDVTCMVSVVAKVTKKNKTISVIAGIMALPDGVECPPRINDQLTYDQDAPDPSVLDRLPQWVREAIESAIVLVEEPSSSDAPPPPPDASDIPF